MQADFNPSSRHRFVLLYDAAALPPDFPVDADLETPEPKPPPHKAVRDLANGCAFVVEVPSEEDCEATFRVFLNESPPTALVAKTKPVVSDAFLPVPSGTLYATGSEFMCLPGQRRKNIDAEPVANIPAGDYLMTVHELVRWKLKHRRKEIRAQTTPLARLVDTITQAFAIICAIILVAHVLVVPIILWISWHDHGSRMALRNGGIILAIDAIFYAVILLLALLEKKFDLFKVAEIRKKFDAEHPDFLIILQKTVGPSSCDQTALFKWPRS